MLLARFRAEPAIRGWLYPKAYRRHSAMVAELLDKADTYVLHGGQAERVAALYAQQCASDTLTGASPTRRAVHRAVFSLAMLQGSPLLASRRYVLAVARAQSGVDVSSTAVGKHLAALSADGLIHVAPGTPGLRSRSGLIELDLTAEPDLGLVLEAVSALTLGSEEILAMRDYRESAQRNLAARSEHAHKPFAERRAREWEAEQRMNRLLLESIDFSDLFPPRS